MPDSDPRPINTPDTLEEAERFQRMFVLPVADAIKTEIRSIISPLTDRVSLIETKQTSVNDRLTQLESSQSKALIGWGVFATGLSIALSAAWDYIKRKVGW